MDEDNNSNWWLHFLIWLIVFLVLGYVVSFFQDDPEFEGRSAKDWYYLYVNENVKHKNFRSCVEQYAQSDEYDELKEIYYQCL